MTVAVEADPLAFGCPHCEAVPGELCRLPSGRCASVYHLPRRQAAGVIGVPPPRRLGLTASATGGRPISYRVEQIVGLSKDAGGGAEARVTVSAGGDTLRFTVRLARGQTTEHGLRAAVEKRLAEGFDA